MLRLFILVVFLFTSLTARADDSTLTREEWLRRVRKELKNSLCEPGHYLRTCTDVDPNNCLQNVEHAADLCVAKINFPAKLDPLDDGLTFGGRLGSCVGDRLNKFIKRRKDTLSSVCDNAF